MNHEQTGPFTRPRLRRKAMNYFEVFELEPTLGLDTAQLEKKFHALSREHHPDYHTDRSPEERERALRMTALVNDAYRILRDSTRRAEYLVRSAGFEVDGSKVPQALLTEVFEINEVSHQGSGRVSDADRNQA
jgi:molecular chaperone HscB